MPFTTEIPVTTDSLLDYLQNNFGQEVGVPQLLAAADEFKCSVVTVKKRLRDYKSGIGKWNLTVAEKLERTLAAPDASPAEPVAREKQNLVPEKDSNYVPFGNFNAVKKIIKSKVFYPTFITGLSGNGKTVSVEQACAQLNRELIRVNITIETLSLIDI